MPRKTRMYVPGMPTHVVQRGHNKMATFFCDDDFRYYKSALDVGLRRYGAALHAYCLMTNHVHLLLTPTEHDSVPRIMQHIGRHYVSYVNARYVRSGALWEGRHKNSLIDTGRYLLATYRYIESNPVAAGMVRRHADYPWSSFHANGIGASDPLLTPHPEYLALASDPERARIAYCAMVSRALSPEDVQEISSRLSASYPYGDDSFRKRVEHVLGKQIGELRAGGAARS